MTEFTMVKGLINPISPPSNASYTLPPVNTIDHTTHATCSTCNGGVTTKVIAIPGTSITFSLNDTLLIMAFIIALIDLAIGLKR